LGGCAARSIRALSNLASVRGGAHLRVSLATFDRIACEVGTEVAGTTRGIRVDAALAGDAGVVRAGVVVIAVLRSKWRLHAPRGYVASKRRALVTIRAVLRTIVADPIDTNVVGAQIAL